VTPKKTACQRSPVLIKPMKTKKEKDGPEGLKPGDPENQRNTLREKKEGRQGQRRRNTLRRY